MNARRFLVAGALACALTLLSACVAADGPHPVPVTQLAIGQCFELDAERTTAFVHPDCETPHDYEVLATPRLDPERHTDPAPFPGEGPLAREASILCESAFREQTGRAVRLAEDASAMFLAPSEESWASGDRRVVCLLASPEAPSAEGGERWPVHGPGSPDHPDTDRYQEAS